MSLLSLHIDGGDDDARGSSIAPGTVINNFDLNRQGKVLVRIPSRDLEVWARLVAIGAGANAGFLYVPRIDDEVLLAFNEGAAEDAYVLGGLWSTSDQPPVSTPEEALAKRIIRTGVGVGGGHTIELDDARRSVRIETSAKQKVFLDPTKIEITTASGALSVTLDDSSGELSVKGTRVTIEATGALTLKGRTVDLKSEAGPLSINSATDCSIQGAIVRIN